MSNLGARSGLLQVLPLNYEPERVRQSFPICADLVATGTLPPDYERGIRRMVSLALAYIEAIEEYPGGPDMSAAKRLIAEATRHATNGIGHCRGRKKRRDPPSRPQPCPMD